MKKILAWLKLKKLHSRLSKLEKRIILIILGLILILGSVKIWFFVNKNTVLIPKEGGVYSEILVGEAKHPDPILARSYIDKTISGLIYAGLTVFNQNGEVKPLLAESWSIPEEGKKYIFKLKQGLVWHDGMPFTAKDVEYTIRTIQNPKNQSPYLDNWKNVIVNVSDKYTVEFSLSEKSAPFLSATTVGIIPAHISLREEDVKMVGIGPFQLDKANIEGGEIKEISLVKNNQWFGKKSWINRFVFRFTDSLDRAEEMIIAGKNLSLFGKFDRQPQASDNFSIFQIPTNKRTMLFLNTAREPFNNLDTRKKILSQASDLVIDQKVILTTDLATEKKQKAKDFISFLKEHFSKLEVLILDPGQLQEKIYQRDYHILILPVELGVDKDLYPIFHSSQKTASGLNLANFEDKALDKILEEARTNLDQNKRNELQKTIEGKIQDQALYLELDKESFYWQINKNVKDVIKPKIILTPENRFQGVENWYIEEQRVMKNP